MQGVVIEPGNNSGSDHVRRISALVIVHYIDFVMWPCGWHPKGYCTTSSMPGIKCIVDPSGSDEELDEMGSDPVVPAPGNPISHFVCEGRPSGRGIQIERMKK